MTMSHKAFIFDWPTFENELAPVLHVALMNGRMDSITHFINEHLNELTDPYEGHALDSSWDRQLERHDLQEIADFALTKYYDVNSDMGLGDAWMSIEKDLDLTQRRALLGIPFGPENNVLDPGRMGSYFQSVRICEEARSLLLVSAIPALNEFLHVLELAIAEKKGIYVTF